METDKNELPIEEKESGQGKRGWLKPVIFIGAVAALIVIAGVTGVGEHLKDARSWIEGLGPWAPVAFIALYIIAAVAFLPGSALTVMAGAVFGSLWGVVYTIIGATIGASLAFLIGRYFARDTVAGWLAKNEKFAKLDQLTEKHGAIIVAVTRLVPVFPFNLLNYGFGLTKVRFSTYVLWSLICMVPGTALYVVGTDAVITGISEGRAPWALIGILVALIAGLALVARKARGWLLKREAECEGEDCAETEASA